MVISPTYVSTQPPEKFDILSRGKCEWHTLFSQPNTATDSMCSGIAICPPRTGHLCRHRHKEAEIYYIISGKGILSIDGKEYNVEEGSSIFIPGDAEHGIANKGDEELRWFYVFPTASFNNVVYRFSDEVGAQEPIVKECNTG
jgi:quercetin dioxygenase-like cupin family protein